MREPQARLAHLVFFEALANTTSESTIEWRTAKAGLVVLRMLDNWAELGAKVITEYEWSVDAVRGTIRLIDEGHPLRELLLTVLDTMHANPEGSPAELLPSLMAYARGLELEAQWALAADVYVTVVPTCARPGVNASAIVAAQMRLGDCRRMLAHWEAAATAYHVAEHCAEISEDTEQVLRAQLAAAELSMDRGHYSKADRLLGRTIARAHREGMETIRAAALHDRARVAHHRGQFDRAIQLGYQALTGTLELAQRDHVLADLAAWCFGVGLHEAACDAHAIVAATAEEPSMRWRSAINVIEIAAMDRRRAIFEHHRRGLVQASLPVPLAAQYHYAAGQGYRAFGEVDLARAALEEAVAIASAHDLTEMRIKAEQSLAEVREEGGGIVAEPAREPPAPAEWSPGVMAVASAIHDMRSRAGVAG